MKNVVTGISCCGLMVLVSLCVAGQDLGSSNKLFGKSKKVTTTKTPAKKALAKRSTTARSKRPSAKPKPKATDTASRTPKARPARLSATRKAKTETNKVA